MSPYLPLFLGFLGALLVGVGVWRAPSGDPTGRVLAGVGTALLLVVTLIYLLVLLGAIGFA